jgi:hypothetical protein
MEHRMKTKLPEREVKWSFFVQILTKKEKIIISEDWLKDKYSGLRQNQA